MENLRDFIVDLTCRITREITVNYLPEDFPGEGPDGMKSPGEEYKVVNILKEHLDSWSIPYEMFARNEKRPNLLAYVGQAKPGYRKLLLVLHTDTVPAGPRDDWSFDPYEPFEKDGKLYGRGVLDNKGPLAASFASFKMLKDMEDQIPGQVIFAAVADEEVEAGFGMDYLLENGHIHCTDALIPDIAGEMKQINIAEKGRLSMKVKFKGKAAHAMNPDKGINAIYAAANYLQKIDGFSLSHEPHGVLDPPTLNTGLIKGGSAPNSVAADCEITHDIRFLPGMTPDGIKSELSRIACDSCLQGASCDFEVSQVMVPTEVKPDAPIVKFIRNVAPDAKLVGSGGITFAKFLVLHGIQAVGWSPGHEETYHMPNEEIEVEQLTTFARRLVDLAKNVSSETA